MTRCWSWALWWVTTYIVPRVSTTLFPSCPSLQILYEQPFQYALEPIRSWPNHIFNDEAKPPLPTFVLPPHVEDVRRCLTDFSCLFNGKDESFHTTSKDIEEGMEQGLNPDPIRKAAERIQHEVLRKGVGVMWRTCGRKSSESAFSTSLPTLSLYRKKIQDGKLLGTIPR